MAASDTFLASSTLKIPQMNGLSADIDMQAFALNLQKSQLDVFDFFSAPPVLTRTIEGASTLKVTLDDTLSRSIQKSGRLGRRVDVQLDGLWFTLVAFKKTGRAIELTFEDREINVLRYYNKFIKASRSDVTRAQFILMMIQEPTEIAIDWEIPELDVTQPVSDIQPGQFLLDTAGNPILGQAPIVPADKRNPGISAGRKFTVQNAPATPEQIDNASTILDVATKLLLPRIVMVTAIAAAIQESGIKNLAPYWDVNGYAQGVYSQHRDAGWPASGDVATDARAFLQAAGAVYSAHPQWDPWMIAGAVQFPALRTMDPKTWPSAILASIQPYAKWRGEAEAIVNAYGYVGSSTTATTTDANAGGQLGIRPPTYTSGGYIYTRGQISKRGNGQRILTPENSWACIQRLASEVNWRAFFVAGKFYYLSEPWLFRSQPYMTISEDTDGIDWIDVDLDEGKRSAEIKITCHLSRWSAPPGSIVEIEGQGPVNGRWIVNDIERPLTQAEATITIKKPRPILPEPTGSSNSSASIPGSTPPTPGGARDGADLTPDQRGQAVVDYAVSQIGVPYSWGGGNEGGKTLGIAQGAHTVGFDCSGLTMAAYATVDIHLDHFAQDQFDRGPRVFGQLMPGDLVFFGTSTSSIDHVGIYVGDGKMIDAPHTGALVRSDSGFQNWTDPKYQGATRPQP